MRDCCAVSKSAAGQPSHVSCSIQLVQWQQFVHLILRLDGSVVMVHARCQRLYRKRLLVLYNAAMTDFTSASQIWLLHTPRNPTENNSPTTRKSLT